jgi:hypothetical protein
VATDTAIEVTDDGGTTWTAGTLPGGFLRFYGVACATGSDCVAVGRGGSFGGTIITSADGGGTWTVTAATSRTMYAASCPTATHCVAVGPYTVDTSDDGGQTWTEQALTHEYLEAISCATATSCVAGGFDSVSGAALAMVSADGGASWTDQTVSSNGNVSALACPAVNVCATAGDDGGPMIATTTDGSTWSLPAVDASIHGIYGYGVSCPSVAWCIAVGDTNSNDGFALRVPLLSTTLGIDTPGAQAGDAGHAVVPLSLHATDSWNAATLTYSATGLPSGLAIDPNTGVITGTPQGACTCSVQVTVTDDAESTASASFAWTVTAQSTGGYRLGARDGGVFSFGAADFAGSAAPVAGAPIVGIAATPDHAGYWLVSSAGVVRAFGAAHAFGNANATDVVGIASTSSGDGYWVVGRDGGVFAFGDAHFYGSAVGMTAHAVVGMTPTPDGDGYWLAAADGGVFSFGAAHSYGSAAGIALRAPVVGITATSDGHGYWLVASDGGVFAFGDAAFLGSAAPITIGAPIVDMVATADDRGYWVVGADGGIFSFGAAGFDGSTASAHLVAPVVGIA